METPLTHLIAAYRLAAANLGEHLGRHDTHEGDLAYAADRAAFKAVLSHPCASAGELATKAECIQSFTAHTELGAEEVDALLQSMVPVAPVHRVAPGGSGAKLPSGEYDRADRLGADFLDLEAGANDAADMVDVLQSQIDRLFSPRAIDGAFTIPEAEGHRLYFTATMAASMTAKARDLYYEVHRAQTGEQS